MLSLNKVCIAGTVTFDPELRHTPAGKPVLDLRLAVNERYTTKDGEVKESTVFIDATTWDRQAETCAQYLKKGSRVYIEGKMKQDTWDDKTSGEKRSKIKIEVQPFGLQFLDPKPQADAPQQSAAPARPAAPSRPPAGRPPATPARRPTPPPPPGDDDDSSIPF